MNSGKDVKILNKRNCERFKINWETRSLLVLQRSLQCILDEVYRFGRWPNFEDKTIYFRCLEIETVKQLAPTSNTIFTLEFRKLDSII